MIKTDFGGVDLDIYSLDIDRSFNYLGPIVV